MRVSIGSCLLTSEKLERRIIGIKLVNEQVKRLLSPQTVSQTLQDDIVNAFIAVDIFGQIFAPQRMHVQIV